MMIDIGVKFSSTASASMSLTSRSRSQTFKFYVKFLHQSFLEAHNFSTYGWIQLIFCIMIDVGLKIQSKSSCHALIKVTSGKLSCPATGLFFIIISKCEYELRYSNLYTCICLHCKHPDQPVPPCSLIRVFSVSYFFMRLIKLQKSIFLHRI